MMVKSPATGKTDNLISCPPNIFGSKGYTVWNENIAHYLQNHGCFSDGVDDYFHY